jgi:Helix-turn-helix domain
MVGVSMVGVSVVWIALVGVAVVGKSVVVMTTDPMALPPERLGDLLRQARRKTSLSRRRAAKAASLRERELAAIEGGKAKADRPTIDRLLDAYDITVDQLVPPRTPIVVGDAPGGESVAGLRVVACDSRDEALATYIAMIVKARAAGRLDSFSLRSDDMQLLAVALGTDDEILVDRIAHLLGCDRVEAEWFGARLRAYAGPIAGVAFGIAVVAGSAMASNTSGASLVPASVNAHNSHVVAHPQVPPPAAESLNG